MMQKNDRSVYQTGNTDHKKSHRGLYIVLIVVVILLVGIVSFMGLLNIHLFRRVMELSPDDYIFQVARVFENEPQVVTEPPHPVSEAPLQISLDQAPEAVANIPQEGGLSLQDIYDRNFPSVVSITTATGNGSGMILSQCGYILTNSQVLGGSQTARVLFHDNTQLDAHVVGVDPLSDLAVLDVDAVGLIPVSFGNDELLQVGDTVVAIGDPLGSTLRGTMTDGFISAINRDLEVDGRTVHLLQTNAKLPEGNSGGPLLNCYGQVIGINTMKLGSQLSSAEPEDIGFAIPSSSIKEVVEQLLRNGTVSGRPGLGFAVETVSAFDQLYYRVPAGLFITSVSQTNLPLQPGDILLRFAGQRVGDTDSLHQALYRYEAGDTVSITIYRGGTQHELQVTLIEEQ